MSMRYSCLPVSLYSDFFSGKTDITQWSAQGATLGLDAVDINALFFRELSEYELQKIRETLTLPVFMVSCYSDFSNPDMLGRRTAVEEMQECIRKTAALGGQYVRLTAGQHYPDQNENKTITDIMGCFAQCCDYAQMYGVGVLLENHSKPGAWDYPDFNFHTERFLRLWAVLQDLPLSINFDIANAYALGAWQQILQAVAGRIGSVHINDLASVEPLRFCTAGDGIVPAHEMMRAVKDSGFHGTICLEEAGFQGVSGMQRAIEFMKKLP